MYVCMYVVLLHFINAPNPKRSKHSPCNVNGNAAPTVELSVEIIKYHRACYFFRHKFIDSI